MNRRAASTCKKTLRVPRASGDEPLTADELEKLGVCSPRQRG